MTRSSSRFARYFLILSLVLAAGIVTAVLQSAVSGPAPHQFNQSELEQHYEYHVAYVIPFMEHSLLRLLLSNSGVALFMLLVPLFWVWIWWFRRDLLDDVILLMQGTVVILVWALGHNSFSRLYTLYCTLPPNVTLLMYLPHGIIEMPAFVLAGTFSLLCIDDLKNFLTKKGGCAGLHPGEISLFVFGNAWRRFVLVFILIAIAAVIECLVTPGLVKGALETALQSAGQT